MNNDKSKNIIITLLVIIIIILGALLVLFATDTITLNTATHNKGTNNTIEADNKSESENDNESSMIEVTLPSNQKISVNKEYKDIFNGNEKIIATSDGVFPYKESELYNKELTLSEFIKKELEGYPDEFYTGKKVLVSSTLFDFDNDGINEIMFSFCEEYILLHYHDGKVYGYTLAGYRSNGRWRVNGTAIFSSSAIDGGISKYSFDGSELIMNIIASSEGDYSNPESTDVKVTYKVNDKIVTKSEYNNFHKEQEKIELIEYVDYN